MKTWGCKAGQGVHANYLQTRRIDLGTAAMLQRRNFRRSKLPKIDHHTFIMVHRPSCYIIAIVDSRSPNQCKTPMTTIAANYHDGYPIWCKPSNQATPSCRLQAL